MASKSNPYAHLMKKIQDSGATKANALGTAPKESNLSKALTTIMEPGFGEPTQSEEKKNISDSENKGLTNVSKSVTSISNSETEKANEAVLTPQALRLLGPSTAEIESKDDAKFGTDFDAADRSDEPSYHGVQELARLNTDTMEPVTERHSNLNVEAARIGKKLQLDSAGTVRELCDALDAKLEKQAGELLQGPALVETRNYVQSLMITLKTRPEFAEVIIDKDMHNVMKFIRSTREEALQLREVKVAKKVTRAVNAEKKAGKSVSQSKMAAAFAKVTGFPALPGFGEEKK